MTLTLSTTARAQDENLNLSLRHIIQDIEQQLNGYNQPIKRSTLESWVDDSELTVKNKDVDDLENSTLGFEISLKNSSQVTAEREILNLGVEKNTIRLAVMLENQLRSRYLGQIDLIEQEMKLALLEQQQAATHHELDSWKARIDQPDFEAQKLQKADLTLDSLWAEALNTKRSIQHRHDKLAKKESVISTVREGHHGIYPGSQLITDKQILQQARRILSQNLFQQHSPAIRKTQLSSRLARQKQKRERARESFALSSVKIEYDDKDDAFGASFGVRVPIAGTSFDVALNQQSVHYASQEYTQTIDNLRNQLEQQFFLLKESVSQGVMLKRLIDKVQQRQQRVSDSGHAGLILDLQTELHQLKERRNNIRIKTCRQFIQFMHSAGMLGAKPYRNWLMKGTPAI